MRQGWADVDTRRSPSGRASGALNRKVPKVVKPFYHNHGRLILQPASNHDLSRRSALLAGQRCNCSSGAMSTTPVPRTSLHFRRFMPAGFSRGHAHSAAETPTFMTANKSDGDASRPGTTPLCTTSPRCQMRSRGPVQHGTNNLNHTADKNRLSPSPATSH